MAKGPDTRARTPEPPDRSRRSGDVGDDDDNGQEMFCTGMENVHYGTVHYAFRFLRFDADAAALPVGKSLAC